jgi:GTP-binding protein
VNTPLVAIIGLPNAGKSTFFNKVLSRRAALTYPEEGTTRDRAYGLTDWNGMNFYLIDTAGIKQRPDSDLEKNIQKQTEIALDEADLIILMVDGKTEPSNKDFAVGSKLSQKNVPVVLAANKIDSRNAKSETSVSQYMKLGLGEPIAMSSVNGAGVGDVLDAVVTKLKEKHAAEVSAPSGEGLKVTFLGKPNVGKSSLVNALLGEERMLVHHEAGTTRSTVEIPFESNGEKFLLLDTAGIKRKWDQDSDVAAAAAFQSIRTLSQTDVALFVLDASNETTVQDQIISQNILENNKSLVVLLNKIDLLDKEAQQRFLDKLPHYFPQIWFAPVIFVSAKTKEGLPMMLKLAQEAYASARKEISVEELDLFLEKIKEEKMPGKKDDQRAPKLYNFKQIGTLPPEFKMTVNFPAAVAEAWKKWFEKQFRLKFGFEGTPIHIRYAKRS